MIKGSDYTEYQGSGSLADITTPEGRIEWPQGLGKTEEPRQAPISIASPEQAARLLMVQTDPLFRSLPYEQRTAVLLNLLVTYAAEQPAALQMRGKFIKGLTEEFRSRLQTYLPLNLEQH